MRKAKRGCEHFTRGFRKRRRASKNESLVSGCFLEDSDQGVGSRLSDSPVSHLSKSLASIVLYNGDTTLFSCSGIAMERQGCHLTRFLTSANLVRAVNGANKDHDDLKIEVRPDGNGVYMGVMDEYDLDCNFVVVNVHAFLDVQVVSFQHAPQILPHEILVLIGRGVSGEIIVRNIEFDGYSRLSEDDEDLDSKTSEAWDGGLLVSDDGKVGGMNLFLTARRAVFLPCDTILKHLEYWASQQKKTGLARSKTSKVYRFGARPIGEESNSHEEGAEVHGDFLTQEQLDLYYMGYPKLPSSMLGGGMSLVNTFEETFGDLYGEGVWRNFGKRASNIDRNVVALASFSGERRFFACTGAFIEWNGCTVILTSASLVRNSGDENRKKRNYRDDNKIVENLRIEVLHRGQYSVGTLQHYSLHYNVAVVSVENQRALRPLNTLRRLCNIDEVAAIGRCFESGALMATSGDIVCWSGKLDCLYLSTSTCKITKAGIGGPLVTLDGDVLGMNFYDKKIGTPFLAMDEICEILESFETKSKPGASFWKMEGDDEKKLNRWPVPMPRWCNPDYVDEDKSVDDEPVFDCEYRFALRYGYIKGERVILC